MLYPDNPRTKNAIIDSMKRAYLPNRTARSLVMLSGGLDSVALLANLLEHTDHEIHAHHIEISNYEKRADIENKTLEKVLEYMKNNYRPFIYSSSKYELMMGLGGGLDMTLAMFMAARVTTAEGKFFDLVWTGHIAPSIYEFMEASAVFTACFTNNRYKPVWSVPFTKLTKLDIYNSIPPELAEITWSCRTPVLKNGNYEICGICHACESRNKIYEDLKKLNQK